MATEEKVLVSYLDPAEQKLLKKIQERTDRNYALIPALYRENKLDVHKEKILRQIESDKYTITVLQKKAAIRRAKEESLSRKVSSEQIERLKRRFLNQETTQ